MKNAKVFALISLVSLSGLVLTGCGRCCKHEEAVVVEEVKEVATEVEVATTEVEAEAAATDASGEAFRSDVAAELEAGQQEAVSGQDDVTKE
jgi:hypothetical protein